MFVTWVAGIVLVVSAEALAQSQVACEAPRVKPLPHVCGIVIDQSGAPVAHATVSILIGGTKLFALDTGGDGKFSFDELKAGSYDVQAQAEGFHTFRFPIVVVKVGEKCRQALEVELTVGSETCPGVRLVKPRTVERRLQSP